MSSSHRSELIDLLPYICSLPALKSLHINDWTVKGSAAEIGAVLASLQDVPSGLSFSLAALTLRCSKPGPCSLFLQSLAPTYVMPSLRSLHTVGVQFDAEMQQIVSHFPNLLILKTEKCEFPLSLADTALGVVQHFVQLRSRRLRNNRNKEQHQQFLLAMADAQRQSGRVLLEAEVPRDGFNYDEEEVDGDF